MTILTSLRQHRWTVLAALTAVALGLVALALSNSQPASSDATPTFGTIPQEAFENESAYSAVPDYVSVADVEGGFVRREHALPSDEDLSNVPDRIPVVDKELTVLGHLVANVGYVPIGKSDAEPTSEIEVRVRERHDDGSVTERILESD